MAKVDSFQLYFTLEAIDFDDDEHVVGKGTTVESALAMAQAELGQINRECHFFLPVEEAKISAHSIRREKADPRL